MTKRKPHPAHRPSKKFKLEHGELDDLPWRPVPRPLDTGLDGDDGVLALEEVDDVEVVYERADGGRVVKFSVLHRPDEPRDLAPTATSTLTPAPAPAPPTFDGSLLPHWRPFDLVPHLLRVLHHKSFSTPTPIQSLALPLALAGRDVIGVAETGSGKTLAYALPILHTLLSRPRPPTPTLHALVITPTRELALQVADHLNAFAHPPPDANANANSLPTTPKPVPLVRIAVLVGGMSAQKQRRILDRGVDVLIATPGRLWDTLEEDESLVRQVQSLSALVLDEADRMIEAGHFAEMDKILRLTVRRTTEDATGPEANEESEGPHLQTFVFSATLSKDLQRNLKRRRRPGPSKVPSTLDDLLLRLDFRDPAPEVVDISPEGGVVATLRENRIECLASEKDAHLYYFLLRYPGRTLVFLSAIDGIRRLVPLLQLLDLKVFPLHSQMEQRQRLKNLDRFKANKDAVLLATDIAARGLDIPGVDHVIHYQVPRSADAFIHRNGRTARANRKGFSLVMCSPEERRVVRALFSSLGRREADVAEMDVERTMLDGLKERIQLAKEIDGRRHRVQKRKHERSWMREAAEAMEIELDSDVVSEDEGPKRKRTEAEMAGMKAELSRMLSRPLIARGVSTRYVTSGSRPIAQDLVSGKVHEAMLGLERTGAGGEETEWSGISYLA